MEIDKIRRGPRERVLAKAQWCRGYVYQRVVLPEAHLPVWGVDQVARAGQQERTGLRTTPDSLYLALC